MTTAKIAFSGFDASIASYELTQIGPISPDSHFAPPLVMLASIPVGQDTFSFSAPTAPGDYTFSVQAYDANHIPAQGPQATQITIPVAPPPPPGPSVDNIPITLSVSLA